MGLFHVQVYVFALFWPGTNKEAVVKISSQLIKMSQNVWHSLLNTLYYNTSRLLFSIDFYYCIHLTKVGLKENTKQCLEHVLSQRRKQDRFSFATVYCSPVRNKNRHGRIENSYYFTCELDSHG